jgi:homogentisate 1,2-dioxygenase
MPFYRSVGEIPAKRHTLAGPADQPHAEELMGLNGFSSSSALLYHRRSPSALVSIESADDPRTTDRQCARPDHPLVPRHLRTGDLPAGTDLVTGRHVLLANRDVTVAVARADTTSPLYRTALGDELTFVQSGRARLETTFGSLDVAPGDYVVVPTATTHRWVIDEGIVETFVIEARGGHIAPPRKYLGPYGQFLEGAPYCERDLRGPTEPLLVDGHDVEVLVRSAGGLSRHVHRDHPFDVVGWDGGLWPYALSIHDFEPIVGLIHQPPPVHQTFEGPGFVICSFVPRYFDFHPQAVKVPYHHANVDSDEVLFYSAGNFMSRAGSGIGVGSISYHPAGFVHGPQPGSRERSEGVDRTEEVAVMLDTFQPLGVTDAARSVSDDNYAWSWSR